MIIHQKGDVVELRGSLDTNQWLALKSVVSLQLKEHPTGIIIDGSGLTGMNEVGAHTFIDASEFIQAQRARVVVAGLSSEIQDEIRRIPGARSQLPLASSVEEARASLAVGGIEAVPESQRKPAILVPLLGEWRSAVHYAAAYADRNVEMHLLYVMEVPRAQPLGVPLPDKEREATEILDEAERELGKHGYTVRRMITRARIAVEGASRFASDTKPRLVVAAYGKGELQRQAPGQDAIATLAGDTPGDVVVYCVDTGADPSAQAQPCKPVVMVPMFGAWVKAISFAAQYAAEMKREMQILYVLEIPRVSPLDIPLPDKERIAQQELSEAERVAKRWKVPVRRAVTRARDQMEGAARFSEDIRPELVTVAYFKDDLIERGARFSVVTSLCGETACDVAIYCAAPE